jgi:hypothetical protein
MGFHDPLTGNRAGLNATTALSFDVIMPVGFRSGMAIKFVIRLDCGGNEKPLPVAWSFAVTEERHNIPRDVRAPSIHRRH